MVYDVFPSHDCTWLRHNKYDPIMYHFCITVRYFAEKERYCFRNDKSRTCWCSQIFYFWIRTINSIGECNQNLQFIRATNSNLSSWIGVECPCDLGANLVQHFIGRYSRYSRYRTKSHDKATISNDITRYSRYQTVLLKLQEIIILLSKLQHSLRWVLFFCPVSFWACRTFPS